MYIAHRTSTGAGFHFSEHTPFAYYGDKHEMVPTGRGEQTLKNLQDEVRVSIGNSTYISQILSENGAIVKGLLLDFYSDRLTHRSRAIVFDELIKNKKITFNQSEIISSLVHLLPLADDSIIIEITQLRRIKERHRFLSDDILDVWIEILNHHLLQQKKKVLVLPTWAYTQIISGDFDIAHFPLFSTSKMVLLPVNIRNHWITVQLSMIKPNKCRLTLLNSLDHRYEDVAGQLRRWIQANFPSSEVEIHFEFGPQQSNAQDCGIFVCMNLAYIAWSQDFDYGMKDLLLIRRWMIYYIYNHVIRNETWFRNNRNKSDFLLEYVGSTSGSGARDIGSSGSRSSDIKRTSPTDPFSSSRSSPTDPFSSSRSSPTDPFSSSRSSPTDPFSSSRSSPTDPFSSSRSSPTDPFSSSPSSPTYSLQPSKTELKRSRSPEYRGNSLSSGLIRDMIDTALRKRWSYDQLVRMGNDMGIPSESFTPFRVFFHQ